MALKLRPAEQILAGYAILVVAVSAVRAGQYPAAVWAGVAHLGILGLLALLALRDQADPDRGGPLRDVLPIVLLLALYGALDLLSGFGARATHDTLVRGWERSLFGGEPGREWWQRAPSRFWSTALHAAYLSYYLIVPAPIALFLARRDRHALARATLAVLVSFVACYLWFIFFPVAGPYYEYPRPAAWFTDNWAARGVYSLLSGGSSYGAAFPSSHVSAAWAAAVATWWGSRRWGAPLLGAAALLTIAVVYCQMHYAVDALAGLASGAVALGVARARYPTSASTARGS